MPRPTICQNFVFERTSLKKTRLTTSGTSMPVSSMSTEIAMCGALSLLGEVVDQALRILGLEGDDTGELTLVVRIVDVEPLGDELGVLLVLGEDDGLAQPVATGHLQAARHQVLQHLVHGVLVEEPLVDGLGLDPVGHVRPRRPTPARPTGPCPLRTGRRT